MGAPTGDDAQGSVSRRTSPFPLPGDEQLVRTANSTPAGPCQFARCALKSDAGQVPDDRPYGHLQFDTREVGAQAVVRAVPKGDVLVFCASDVECFRSREVLRIEV